MNSYLNICYKFNTMCFLCPFICECICKRLRFKLFLFLFILCSWYMSWSVLWKPCYQERKRCTTTINWNVVCVSEREKKKYAVLRHKCVRLLSDALSGCCFDTCQLHTSVDVCVCVCKCAWVGHSDRVTWASVDPVGDEVAGWSAVWVSWNI